MERKNKLIIAIIIVAAIGIVAVVWGTFFSGPDLLKGEKNILVLAVDETEERPGMGAVDMAFVVKLKDGNIVNYTAIYPGSMKHSTEAEPAEAGSGKLLLHDALWYNDTTRGMGLAKEIVESNTNITTDAVVAINTKVLDGIISSAGSININGTETNVSGLDLVRENDELNGGSMTRGEAVMALAKSISTSAKDETTHEKMVQAALDQYSKGNIVMVPEGSFMNLIASKGLRSLIS